MSHSLITFLLLLAAAPSSWLQITPTDTVTGLPVPCRLSITRDSIRIPLPQLPRLGEDAACPGFVALPTAPGRYAVTVSRGPEWRGWTGEAVVEEGGTTTVTPALVRVADLASENWYAVNPSLYAKPGDALPVMRAMDIRAACLVLWGTPRAPMGDDASGEAPPGFIPSFPGGRDRREGGTLLYCDMPEPQDAALALPAPDIPPMLALLEQAMRVTGAWQDVEDPLSPGLPVWIGAGATPGIRVIGGPDAEAWQTVYFQLLECGLRLYPSAGGTPAMAPNEGRVYAYVPGALDDLTWRIALRSGQVLATDGPLLRITVNTKPPGHAINLRPNAVTPLLTSISLDAASPILWAELIHNGRAVERLTGEELAQGKQFGALLVDGPGWLLVRAASEGLNCPAMAVTGPIYITTEEAERRVSRAAVIGFITRLDAWEASLRSRYGAGTPELAWCERARGFWEGLLAKANAE